jgi:hypothetical protein
MLLPRTARRISDAESWEVRETGLVVLGMADLMQKDALALEPTGSETSSTEEDSRLDTVESLRSIRPR